MVVRHVAPFLHERFGDLTVSAVGAGHDGDGFEALNRPGDVFTPQMVDPVSPAAPVETVLAEAQRIVDGPRRENYGDPKENHQRTADLWNAYSRGKADLTPRDVCVMNILQKISRDAHSPQRDNLVDIAGYARNAEIVT